MEKNNLKFFILSLSFDILMVSVLFLLSLEKDLINYENSLLNLVVISSVLPVSIYFYFNEKNNNMKKLFFFNNIFSLIIVVLVFLTIKYYSFWFILSVISLIVLTVTKRIYTRQVNYIDTNSNNNINKLKLSEKVVTQIIFIVLLILGVIVSFFTKEIIITLMVITLLIGTLLFRYTYKRVLIVNKELFLYGTVTSLASSLITLSLDSSDLFKLFTILGVIITAFLARKTLKMF